MFKADYQAHTLIFNFPGGTSRGVLTEKPSWYIKLWNHNNPDVVGIGEISIIPGLSPESPELIEQYLYSFKQNPESMLAQFDGLTYPTIKFAVETALIDLNNGGNRILFPSEFTGSNKGIQINGLVWMGNKDEMLERLKQKVDQGFKCIKIKVGAINFEEELQLLKYIRKSFSEQDVEIRVDANGAFAPEHALEKIEALSKFKLHSIEQPIKQGQYEQMAKLCQNTPIPIALDEELIGIHEKEYKKQLLEYIKPQYIILKPSLVGGLFETNEWGQLANSLGIGWWVTSALEGNIGLNAIAQWTFEHGSKMPQGLGTGQVFTNNIDSPLEIRGQELWFNSTKEWGALQSSTPALQAPPQACLVDRQGGDGTTLNPSNYDNLKKTTPKNKMSTNTDETYLNHHTAAHLPLEGLSDRQLEVRGWNTTQSITLNNSTYHLKELNWENFIKLHIGQWWVDIVSFLKEWNSSEEAIKLYTSGTTGKPKQIIVEKQKMLISANKTCEYFNLSNNSTALLCLSANYIAGKMMLVRALLSGMNLICVEPSNNPLATIAHEIDFTAMVPMQVMSCVQLPNFKYIKNLIIGGGKVDINLINDLQTSQINAFETFGMTETLSHIALKQIAPNCTDTFKTLEGISISQNYNNELVIDYPELDLYKLKTNDIIDLVGHNGEFKWNGRSDFVINSGGIKISPEQIEKQIQHLIKPLFCIVGLPDKKLGEKVVLVIEGAPFNTESLLSEMGKSLPSYYLPKQVKFVSEIPLTQSGKIQRKKIFEPKT